MSAQNLYRTMWMFPRDKRHQWAVELMGQLQVLRSVVGSLSFSGNQSVQDQFIRELEIWGLKKGESTKQVKNSGGARTYLARFKLLGLIFEHEKIPYLTLAGEAIANGQNPNEVLRHQLLAMQYPSPYSTGRMVNISPTVNIKPVQFIIALLSDPLIQTLTQLETIIPIIYGRNNSCMNTCKDKILKLRRLKVETENSDTRYKAIGSLIDNDQDIRTKKANMRSYRDLKAIKDIYDIANTLKCYMESTGLISVDQTDQRYKYYITQDMKDWTANRIKKYSLDEIETFEPTDNKEYFARRYGRFDKTKDTRQISSLGKRYNLESPKDFTVNMFCKFLTETGASLNEIPEDFLAMMSTKHGVDRFKVRNHLSSITQYSGPDKHLTLLSTGGGGENAIQFEKYLALWLKEFFKTDTNPIGQLRSFNNKKPNADILVSAMSINECGLIDAKAYSSDYSLPINDRRAMKSDYPAACLEHRLAQEDLKFVGYICGTISSNITNLERHLKEISDEIGIPASMISIPELIDFKNKLPKDCDFPNRLFDIFKKGGVLNSSL